MRVDDRNSPIAVRRMSLPKSLDPRWQPTSPDPLIKTCAQIVDRLSGLSKLFAEAMLTTGARPQEILNLTQGDIDDRGFILIRSLKGSRQRVAYCPSLKALAAGAQTGPSTPLFRSYTYHQFYRAFKSVHPSPGESSLHNLKVGRLFRCAFARGNHALGAGDISCTALSLGHRAPSSTNFYLTQGGELSGQDSSRNTRIHHRQGG